VLTAVPWLADSRVESREVRVAVATNFKQTLETICDAFHRRHGGRCIVSAGASGLLFAKLFQGAPFDVFLSADVARAERLESARRAVPGTRFTYAVGQLAFWRPGRPVGPDLRAALADGKLRTIAIAHPDSAPYGAAALETLRSLGIDVDERFEVVRGESVGQAFQFVASGAADAGFVAYSQVLEYEAASARSIRPEVVVVDPELHGPIEQQAVLLDAARDRDSAREFLRFLQSPDARRIIVAAGYAAPPASPP
jgi:molybdate transport system substrate-binding protein